MNGRRKGARIEKEFDDLMKAEGWVTHRATNNQWNRNDIFGCWDVMAKHPKETLRDLTLYFQISTRWKIGASLLEVEAFPLGVNDFAFLVRKKNRKPFEVRIFNKLDRLWVDFNLGDIQFLNTWK